MTDFIIAVDDPVSWHRQNLQLNPKDYAGWLENSAGSAIIFPTEVVVTFTTVCVISIDN